MIQKKSLSGVYFFWKDFSIFIVSIIQHIYYAQTFSRISSNAFLELVWQRITSALHLPASSTAQRTILWDTVFVKRTIRSGLPICLLKLADIWVKIFALQLNCLQTFLYWHTILSCPPMITTLILNLLKLRSDYLLLYLLFSCMFYEFISTYLPCSLVTSNLCIYYTITKT